MESHKIDVPNHQPTMFIKERFLKLENINANENVVPMFECKNLFNLPSGKLT